jgi:hypothetical protein
LAILKRYAHRQQTSDGMTISVGSLSCFISTALGGKSNLNVKEAAYMDWHLIESYVFLTLIMFPPLSVISIFE